MQWYWRGMPSEVVSLASVGRAKTLGIQISRRSTRTNRPSCIFVHRLGVRGPGHPNDSPRTSRRTSVERGHSFQIRRERTKTTDRSLSCVCDSNRFAKPMRPLCGCILALAASVADSVALLEGRRASESNIADVQYRL